MGPLHAADPPGAVGEGREAEALAALFGVTAHERLEKRQELREVQPAWVPAGRSILLQKNWTQCFASFFGPFISYCAKRNLGNDFNLKKML